MSGIYYALSIFGMLVIVVWYVRNDGLIGTKGLLTMKMPPVWRDDSSVSPGSNSRRHD